MESPEHTTRSDAPTPAFLRWPPPGLERLQGDLWRVAGRGALAGGLLVLPLLFVAARRQDLTSLGPFADAWWVSLVLATVGLGFAADALATTARVLGRTARALERGYDARTVAFVLVDHRRDMGFLLQGGRHFAVMKEMERETVALLRVLSVGCHALAGLWLPVALGAALFAGSRGLLDPREVSMVTLAPAALLYAVGAILSGFDEYLVQRARKLWFKKPWALDLVEGEIESWRRDLSEHHGRPLTPAGQSPRRRSLRGAATVVGFLSFVVAVPVLTLVPTSAIGPVLAMLALPTFDQVQRRAARVEALRGYRVVIDTSISPQDGGRLLQELLYVGSDSPPPEGEKAPDRRIGAPWLPVAQQASPVGVEAHRWAEELFARVTAQPSAGLLAYLEGIAGHPAQEDFARLARAAELDAASGRWQDPLPAGLTMERLPIPRFAGLREGAHARIAAAAHDLANGRSAEAEQKVREVLSVGLLLGDDGPTLIDNLIGNFIAETGATALLRLYEVEGRDADAERLRELQDAARRAAERIATPHTEGTEAFVRSLPILVMDTTTVRGLRWEFFGLTTMLTPCLNLHRMVFGPGEEYRRFLEEARASLVRWPSEEGLYQLARAGYWPGEDGGRANIIGRVLSVSMRSGEGTCGDAMRRLDTLTDAI